MVFDYIFCGYGMSAMLLLEKLASDGRLHGKSVLVLHNATQSEKTWCYWENGAGSFDEIITKQWNEAVFIADAPIEILQGKNTYKMLEPKNLETWVSERLSGFSGIVFREESVHGIIDNGQNATVSTDNEKYIGNKIFTSIPAQVSNSKDYPLLLQHFVGWTIETEKPVFTPDCATFMDFSIPQNGNTRFIYVLPLSAHKALVEYTLFSPGILTEAEYENGIKEYLQSKGILHYRIDKKENGVIPMTAYPFRKKNSKNILHIGTAGGWTKPSTGYTFMYAVKKVLDVSDYVKGVDPDFSKFHRSDRFSFYDRIFVSVLYHENALGKYVFSTLFKRAEPELVLRFLRQETTFTEDLRILYACPKRLFVKHLLRHFGSLF